MSAVLDRLNSYLRKHFQVHLLLGKRSKKGKTDGIFWSEEEGKYFFKPLGRHEIYEIQGDSQHIECTQQKLQSVLELLLDGWVNAEDQSDRLSALEVHMLHQLFQGEKVIPFRQRTPAWEKTQPVPTPNHAQKKLSLDQPWQAVLGPAEDALFIGQEISRLLQHQFFIRITTPMEWMDFLQTPEVFEAATVLVELEKFPPKSFLLKERPQIMCPDSFLLLQSLSAKTFLRLPHSGSDFMVISGDLKSKFNHKYLKDCARHILGLPPLYRLHGKEEDTSKNLSLS